MAARCHQKAEPARGRFRSYLLAAARHALLDWKKHQNALRRGGGQKPFSLEKLKEVQVPFEPADGATPEEEFDRRWAQATWQAAMAIFKDRHDSQLVEVLEMNYLGERELTQDQAAQELGISVAAYNSRIDHRA